MRRDTEVAEVVEGIAKVKNERRGEERHGGAEVVEVAEVMEGTAKVKNERHGEERHGGGRGCGGDSKG